jgi:hypothetical protein
MKLLGVALERGILLFFIVASHGLAPAPLRVVPVAVLLADLPIAALHDEFRSTSLRHLAALRDRLALSRVNGCRTARAFGLNLPTRARRAHPDVFLHV